jgi:hypothetical protein
MDDLVIAFVMRCDAQNLTVEEGVGIAEQLGDDLVMAAEDRASYAQREEGEHDA